MRRDDPQVLTPDAVLRVLRTCGAYMDGHFRLTSGRHSGVYIEKFRLLEHPESAELLCAEIARRYSRTPVDVVLGPAVGGVIIAYETARLLGVRCMFAERQEGALSLRRGFRIAEGEAVLVVEDVVTTGGSLAEILELVRKSRGTLVGAAALVDRSGGLDFGTRVERLCSVDADSWEPEECPLCASGMPISERGSRHLG